MSSEPPALAKQADGGAEHRLECSLDDEGDPQELTVFTPESPDLTTEWITIDYDAAVPSSDWR